MSVSDTRKTLLVVSQTYVPDPAAVGQYMHEAAAAMVQHGWRVVVYASARGYEDPAQRFARREVRDGVEIRRLPFCSFGKASILIRLLGGFLFVGQVMLRTLFMRRPTAALVSTSPPMAMLVGVWLHLMRRVPSLFWAMDINPDQMIAAGKIHENSMAAKIFNAMDRAILRRASAVVALDHYMAERLERKHPVADRMHVIPPWPQAEQLQPVDHADNPFRRKHNLEDRFVIMYSGNISPMHPVQTLIEAAAQVQDDERLLILFVGGASGRADVERLAEKHGLRALLTLPYQPLDQLKYSLSAADAHLVSMGQNMVGIVHPCKVYGAMTVSRPVLLLGPEHCHVGEILQHHACGWQVDHGDVQGCADAIRRMLSTSSTELNDMGVRARQATETDLSRQRLVAQFCDLFEQMAANANH